MENKKETTKPTPEEAVEMSIKTLKEAGFKDTNRRRQLLEIFTKDEKYHTATEVHELMKKHSPTISYNTTYRNIYDFVNVGILSQTEFNQEQWFRMTCWQISHHHHHFICTSCGLAIPLDACPMDNIKTDLSKVEIATHRFEVFGKCETCLQTA